MKARNTSQAFSVVELLVTLFIASAFVMAGFQLYAAVAKDSANINTYSKASDAMTTYLEKYKKDAISPCTSQTLATDQTIPVEGLPDATISVEISCQNSNPLVQFASSGGTKDTTTVPGSTIHKFTTVGNTYFTLNKNINIEYLVVAGGGGSAAGGGGGGEYATNTTTLAAGTYTITVGNGGTPSSDVDAYAGGNGGNSSLIGGSVNITTNGGGGGGKNNGWGPQGGSGGGAGASSGTACGGDTACYGGAHTGSYTGYRGGNTWQLNGVYPAAGGGGAGSVGESNRSSIRAGDGGNGASSSITGVSTCYAGGGGGGAVLTNAAGAQGRAWPCGGGSGGEQWVAAVGGTANTGGGGGGGSSLLWNTPSYDDGTAGGSGIVVIRFLTPSTLTQVSSMSKITLTLKYGSPQKILVSSTWM